MLDLSKPLINELQIILFKTETILLNMMETSATHSKPNIIISFSKAKKNSLMFKMNGSWIKKMKCFLYSLRIVSI